MPMFFAESVAVRSNSRSHSSGVTSMSVSGKENKMKGETTSGNERICKLHTYHSYLNFTLSKFLPPSNSPWSQGRVYVADRRKL